MTAVHEAEEKGTSDKSTYGESIWGERHKQEGSRCAENGVDKCSEGPKLPELRLLGYLLFVLLSKFELLLVWNTVQIEASSVN